jgi:hypothetical protein
MIKNVFFLPNGDKWSIMNNNLAMVPNERQLKKNLGVDKSAAFVDLNAEADQLLGELKKSLRANSFGDGAERLPEEVERRPLAREKEPRASRATEQFYRSDQG